MIRGTPNIIFSEGRCVGGSTVINGGICWRTPEKVLARWRTEFGFSDMTDQSLDPIFTKVEQRINVAPQDPGTVGEDAELMRRGAEKLGWRVVPVKRNQKHCAGTNNCAFGCPTDAKQSTLVSYVPRALANGARLFAGCRAEQILTDGQRATGVVARFRDPETRAPGPKLTVRAKVVVLACGAIQTLPHSSCAIESPIRRDKLVAIFSVIPTPRQSRSTIRMYRRGKERSRATRFTNFSTKA